MRTSYFKGMVVVFCWVLLIVSTSLVFGRTYLTGDSLFLDHVYRDVIVGGDSWNAWRLTVSPAFVPDIVAYFAGALILPFPMDRIVFVSVVQAVLIAASVLFLIRVVCSSVSWLTHVLVVLGVSFVSLTASTTTMWAYFNTTNNHVPYLIFGILGAAFLIRAVFSGDGKSFFFLWVCVSIGTVSAPLFYVTYVPSAILSLLALLVVAWKSGLPKGRAVASLLTIGAGFVAGKLLEIALVPNPLVEGRAGWSAERAATSLKWYLSNEREILLSGDIKYYAIYLVVVSGFFLAAYQLFPKIKYRFPTKVGGGYGYEIEIGERDSKNYFLCFFLFLLVGINWAATIFSGAYLDSDAHRYFMLPAYLGATIVLIALNGATPLRPVLSGRFGLAVGGVAVVLCTAFTAIVAVQQVQAGVWTQETRRWGMPVAPFREDIRCFDSVKETYGLHRGVSTFWVARRTTLLSERGTEILPFFSDLSAFHWMNSVNHFFPPAKEETPFDFVVAIRGKDPFGLSPETVAGLNFTKSLSVPCGSDYEVIISQDDSLNRLVHLKNFALPGGGTQSFILPKEALFRNTGLDENGVWVADGQVHAPGFLIYGPYTALPSGTYHVEVDYELSDAGEESSSFFDAGRFNKDSVTFYKGMLEPGRRTHVAEFTIAEALPHSGEFRVFFDGKGKLSIYEVRLERR